MKEFALVATAAVEAQTQVAGELCMANCCLENKWLATVKIIEAIVDEFEDKLRLEGG